MMQGRGQLYQHMGIIKLAGSRQLGSIKVLRTRALRNLVIGVGL